MSVLIPSIGTLEEPISLLLTDTNVASVLTMAAGRPDITTIAGIIVANADSSARLVSIWWTLNATDYLIFRRSVAANETVTEALSYPVKLDAKSTARVIKAQAAAGNVVTVTLIPMQANPQSGR